MAFPSLKDFSRWVSSAGIFFPGEGRKEEEGAERGHDCRSHFSAPGKPIEPPGRLPKATRHPRRCWEATSGTSAAAPRPEGRN